MEITSVTTTSHNCVGAARALAAGVIRVLDGEQQRFLRIRTIVTEVFIREVLIRTELGIVAPVLILSSRDGSSSDGRLELEPVSILLARLLSSTSAVDDSDENTGQHSSDDGVETDLSDGRHVIMDMLIG